jgi:hypothetical protein
MDTLWEEHDFSARSGGTTSASLRTPTGSSKPMTCSTSAVHTPPHHSAGKGPAEEDDEDDEYDDYALSFHVHHHYRDEWCPAWYPRRRACTNKATFLIPSVYELTKLKIVTNLACLILAGSQ